MKVVIIHGQSHKGSTYHIAHMLAEKISSDIKAVSYTHLTLPTIA